jgi:hypothetical protein
MWSIIIGKILTTMMSWADAGNLRNRVYKLQDQAEIMITTLEDIRRMDQRGSIGEYAQKTLDILKKQNE